MPNSSRRSGLRIGRRLDRLVALLHQDHLREASLQFGEPGLEARTLRQCFGQFHGPTLDRSDVRTPDRAADYAASMSDDAVLQRAVAGARELRAGTWESVEALALVAI